MRKVFLEFLQKLRGTERIEAPPVACNLPSAPRLKEIRQLEDRLSYHFRNPALLDLALTHKSYSHETPPAGAGMGRGNYESLEFLGDSILGLVISEFLFLNYPDRNEGELSKIKSFLVSTTQLHRLSQGLNLGPLLRLSYGEEKTGGREKKAILADLFESLVAALYLDGGLPAAREFILSQFRNHLDQIASRDMDLRDYKSRLQETLHRQGLPGPRYEVVSERGPDHQKEFVIQVRIRSDVLARGRGKSKKEAEQRAAFLAIQQLRERRIPSGSEEIPIDEKGHNVE